MQRAALGGGEVALVLRAAQRIVPWLVLGAACDAHLAAAVGLHTARLADAVGEIPRLLRLVLECVWAVDPIAVLAANGCADDRALSELFVGKAGSD